VAQHVFALVLELASRVGEHASAVRGGEWVRSPDFCFWHAPPIELAGLRMGVVGLGRIGWRVASLARAFGMEVVASTRSNAPVEAVEVLPLPDLLARADVVSLHCPANAETEGMIDRVALASMKPSAFLVNTARGALIDEAALADALAGGRLAGAAVDVVSVEPMRSDNPLLGAPRCIVTPHMAWASLAARRRLMEATAANVAAFLAGEPINRVA
jgi:glycerate dehydrogenase